MTKSFIKLKKPQGADARPWPRRAYGVRSQCGAEGAAAAPHDAPLQPPGPRQLRAPRPPLRPETLFFFAPWITRRALLNAIDHSIAALGALKSSLCAVAGGMRTALCRVTRGALAQPEIFEIAIRCNPWLNGTIIV